MEVAPFFVNFHHFLLIFTIFYRFSRFTHFCRDLYFVAINALFPQIFFGQNSLLRNITRVLHVCIYTAYTHITAYTANNVYVLLPPLTLLTLLKQFWSKEAIMLLHDMAMWLYRLLNKMLGDGVEWMDTSLTITISRGGPPPPPPLPP